MIPEGVAASTEHCRGCRSVTQRGVEQRGIVIDDEDRSVCGGEVAGPEARFAKSRCFPLVQYRPPN